MNTRWLIVITTVALIALAGVGAVGTSAQEAGDKAWDQEEISTPYAMEATNDTVYVVDDTDTVYAVDAQSGGIKWRRSLPEGKASLSTTVRIGDQNIYLKVSGRETGDDNYLFAYSKAGNGLVWDHQIPVIEENVYIDYIDESVYLYQNPRSNFDADTLQQFNPMNGEITATTTIPSETTYSAGVVMTGEYVATGNDSTVSIISVESGEIVWQQRYGTVGAIYGDQSLHVVAGSDPVNNEFTSHVLSYDIATRERTNDYNFPYDSRKAELFATTEERLLFANPDDEQVIGYNTSAGELEYDISQDTDYAFDTAEDIFIADESIRSTRTGEEVSALQSSLNLRGRGNAVMNNEFVFLQADDFNADHLIAVSVGSENAAPTANDIDISTSEDSSVSETFAASDPDGDSLSYTIESPPSDGTVSVSEDSFSYTPESISSGTDSFVYRVNDGNGGTDTAIVSVTVTESTSTDPTERALQRFDDDGDGTIDRDEAVGAIVAYNIGSTIGGEEVTRTQVVRAIVAYNTGEPIDA